MTLECSKGNRRMRKTYSINEGRSLLVLFHSASPPKSSRLLLFHLSRNNLPDTRWFIYIYISRLDKSHIRCRNINIYQTKIHETHMEEGFSLLSTMKKFRLQPNAWDKDSSVTKGFWVPLLQRLMYTIHQHNFSLQKYISNTLPKACIYMKEIRQFRRLRRLRQLR